jgi:hypothetical protein
VIDLTLAVRLSGLGFGIFLAGTTPAFAYVDPGTGSLILQLLLGGFAGVAVVGRLYFQRISAFFQRIGGSFGTGRQTGSRR